MLTAFPHPAPTPRPQRKQGFAVARLCLVLCCLMWLPLTLWAEKWRPETLPMVYLQDARRHVCNPDHILDTATVAQADSLLTALERDKGVQTVVFDRGGYLYTGRVKALADGAREAGLKF